MAIQAADGSFEIKINEDQTQVVATIRPPSGNGSPVTEKQITDWLIANGVVRGQRLDEIQSAVVECCRELRVVRAIVAQGILPVDGTDAKVVWYVDADALGKPLPRVMDGAPDLFAIEERRFVQKDQLLANIVRATAGRPGQTVMASARLVPPSAPKEIVLLAGAGVKVTADGTGFYAEASGYAELSREKITVTGMTLVTNSLGAGSYRYSGDVVIKGDITGAHIYAEGSVAISGQSDGASIRARGTVHIRRANASNIAGEGNIYVSDEMISCNVITAGKLIASEGAKLFGGNISATLGVDAWEVGSESFDETTISVGEDGMRDLREREISVEIKECEASLEKIDKALKSAISLSARAQDAQTRSLAEALRSQRRAIETRLGNIRSEARHFAFNKTVNWNASVIAHGTAHPGVIIQIGGASFLNEQPHRGVTWSWDHPRRAIVVKIQLPQAA